MIFRKRLNESVNLIGDVPELGIVRSVARRDRDSRQLLIFGVQGLELRERRK